MGTPLMPRATAVWLVDNTGLSFKQIAEFCGLHELEIQAIADGEVASNIVGMDPIANGQVSKEEIEKGEKDNSVKLRMLVSDTPVQKKKGARYTPVSKRQDRPDGIAWIIKHHPTLEDTQIKKLLGTTKQTITAIREKTHKNTPNIKPKNPVTLGLCTELDLEKALAVSQAKKRKKEE